MAAAESPYFALPQEGPPQLSVGIARRRRSVVEQQSATTTLLADIAAQAQRHAQLLTNRQAQLQDLKQRASQWPPLVLPAPALPPVALPLLAANCAVQERTIAQLRTETVELERRLQRQQDDFVAQTQRLRVELATSQQALTQERRLREAAQAAVAAAAAVPEVKAPPAIASAVVESETTKRLKKTWNVEGLWYWTLAFQLVGRLMNQQINSPELNMLFNELPGILASVPPSAGSNLLSNKVRLDKALADLGLLRSAAGWIAKQLPEVNRIVNDDIPPGERARILAFLRPRFERRMQQLLLLPEPEARLYQRRPSSVSSSGM